MKRPSIDALNQGSSRKAQFPHKMNRSVETFVDPFKIKCKRKLPKGEKATTCDSRNDELSNPCDVINLYVRI